MAPVLIATGTYNTSSGDFGQSRRTWVASTGRRIALIEDSSSNLYYVTSADGVTWSGVSTLSASGLGMDSSDYQSDTLYWFKNGNFYKSVFNTGTNLFGAVTTLSTSYNGIQAQRAWDSTNSVYHRLSVGASTTVLVRSVNTSGTTINGPTTAYVGTTLVTPYGLLCIPGATSTVYALFWDAGASALVLLPMTYTTGGGYVIGSGEGPSFTSAVKFAACEFDNSNNIDIVYVDNSNNLQHIKRTGTSTYSGTTQIASNVLYSTTRPTPFSMTPDGSGGLYIFYETNANQANGEIYSVARAAGGSWGASTLLAGGDTAGYQFPRATKTFTSNRADIIYQASSGTTGNLYYVSYATASAPNTPTNTAPANAGAVSTLTPTLSFTYTNPATTDTMGGYEIIVTRVSDSVQFWDSGIVAGATTSVVYAGTALVYGTQYNFKVRVKDSVLGTFSSYSTTTTFTPYQAGTSTWSSIAGTGSSPVSLTSPTSIAFAFTWSQPQTDTANAYTINIYQNDGVTLVATTSGALSPTLASGSTKTITWSPSGLVNSSTYKASVSLTDTTTGLTVASSQWTLNTTWTPPAAPTGFTATPDGENGRFNLAWTNAGAAVTVNVLRRPNGTSTWTTIHSGDLRTTAKDWQTLNTAYDYGVQTVDSLGVLSTIATALNVTLGITAKGGGHWLNDLTTPDTLNAALGGEDQESTATGWAHIEDANSYVPLGRNKPITTYGKADYWQAIGRTYFFPSEGTSSTSPNTSGAAILANLQTMNGNHKTLRFRDPLGVTRWVEMKNLTYQLVNDIHYLATFDLSEVSYSGTDLVL